MKTQKEYLRSLGNCPRCNSRDISPIENVELDGNGGYQKINCKDCNLFWYDILKLIGLEIMDDSLSILMENDMKCGEFSKLLEETFFEAILIRRPEGTGLIGEDIRKIYRECQIQVFRKLLDENKT